MKKPSFQEHNDTLLLGVFAGLLSGLFFIGYSELKSQFSNFYVFAGVLIFVLTIYYVIILGISYGMKYFQYYLIKKKHERENDTF